MAKSTLNAHISAAIELQKRQGSAYLVFGKTSPWDNELNPPEEVEDTTAISEIVGYKKTKQFSLARPVRTGETPAYPVVTYGGLQWVLIPADKAYTEKARWLYIEAEILPDEFPLGEFRQVGVHLGLVPKSGVTKQNLLPSEVGTLGELQFYENREPQNRTSSVFVTEQFIIKV
ncbi:structural protein [Bacillus phage Mater]|uniref:Structural protein n=1 Tax=Bacillus phage Mater TaxID=1540090 RepID=A0A0A0RML6_9CAUD|nr:virion structural protein [Bacillus phage Mater]AIW03305.1 structural protein [Bacillus phage Mater]